MRTAAAGFPILAVLVAALIGGCASKDTATSSSTSGVMGARDKLVADIRQCSQQHGYDPNQVQGVAENALAPQELQWRQCAYDAVRVYEQAHPALRSQYDQLIAEDIAMTTAIQQGTTTRSQRRARIEELIAEIRSTEETQAKATAAEQERQMEQIRNVVESARGFGY